jgi:hypothetical protein
MAIRATRFLLPLLGIICLLLVMSDNAYTHQDRGPITKEALLKVIKELHEDDLDFLIQQVQSRTVDFPLKDDKDFRDAGHHLSKQGLDKLITAIRENYRAPEPRLSGLLTPGAEATPSHPCDELALHVPESMRPPPNSLAIHYGDGGSWLIKIDKHVVIQIGNEELLSVRKHSHGISVSAKVFSADSRIVAQITDNEFHVNPNNYFRLEQDEHSLTVYDQEAVRVLSVHFLNPHVVSVLGVFRYPNAPIIVIDEHEVRVGKARFHVFCLADSSVGIRIGG